MGEESDNAKWEYYCEGKSIVYSKNTVWGSIGGFTSQTGSGIFTTIYTHLALADKDTTDGQYQVRVAGTDAEYTIKKTTIAEPAKSEAPYKLNDPIDQVKLIYMEDMAVDYDALFTDIYKAVVAEPAVHTTDNVTITYYATSTTGYSTNGCLWKVVQRVWQNTINFCRRAANSHFMGRQSSVCTNYY